MFKKIIDYLKVPDKPIQDMMEVCKYESDNKECNLIQQLKNKQSDCKKLSIEIKTLRNIESSCTQGIYAFFQSLNQTGFGNIHFGYDVRSISNLEISILANALQHMSQPMFNKLVDELKTLRDQNNILVEKQNQLSNLQKDVAQIKTQLGIE